MAPQAWAGHNHNHAKGLMTSQTHAASWHTCFLSSWPVATVLTHQASSSSSTSTPHQCSRAICRVVQGLGAHREVGSLCPCSSACSCSQSSSLHLRDQAYGLRARATAKGSLQVHKQGLCRQANTRPCRHRPSTGSLVMLSWVGGCSCNWVQSDERQPRSLDWGRAPLCCCRGPMHQWTQ